MQCIVFFGACFCLYGLMALIRGRSTSLDRLLSKKASNADNLFGTKARISGAVWLIVGIAMIVLSIVYVKPF